VGLATPLLQCPFRCFKTDYITFFISNKANSQPQILFYSFGWRYIRLILYTASPDERSEQSKRAGKVRSFCYANWTRRRRLSASGPLFCLVLRDELVHLFLDFSSAPHHTGWLQIAACCVRMVVESDLASSSGLIARARSRAAPISGYRRNKQLLPVIPKQLPRDMLYSSDVDALFIRNYSPRWWPNNLIKYSMPIRACFA